MGAGVELPGDYADAVEENEITNNPSDGVLAFEYPNPFPAQVGVTIFFQNSGQQGREQHLLRERHDGSRSRSSKETVAFEGGTFGPEKSVNNCLTGNTFAGNTFPKNIEGEWGCQNKTTPNPGGGSQFIEYLLFLQGQSEGRTQVAQPAPPVQETMPNPCREVPQNPLCP